jgi:hypothetical protein
MSCAGAARLCHALHQNPVSSSCGCMVAGLPPEPAQEDQHCMQAHLFTTASRPACCWPCSAFTGVHSIASRPTSFAAASWPACCLPCSACMGNPVLHAGPSLRSCPAAGMLLALLNMHGKPSTVCKRMQGRAGPAKAGEGQAGGCSAGAPAGGAPQRDCSCAGRARTWGGACPQ